MKTNENDLTKKQIVLARKTIIEDQDEISFDYLFEQLLSFKDYVLSRVQGTSDISFTMTKEYYGHDGVFELVLIANRLETEEEFSKRLEGTQNKKHMQILKRISNLEQQIEELKSKL